MTEQEALRHKVDRSKWPAGPWDNEPEDRVDFEHRGLACLALRNRSGFWCGYVGVGPEHPAFAEGFSDSGLDVHGGITFTGMCSPPICHVPKSGMPAEVKWFGFDCAHCWDLYPRERALVFSDDPMSAYRTLGYVKNQIEQLADQLAAMA